MELNIIFASSCFAKTRNDRLIAVIPKQVEACSMILLYYRNFYKHNIAFARSTGFDTGKINTALYIRDIPRYFIVHSRRSMSKQLSYLPSGEIENGYRNICILACKVPYLCRLTIDRIWPVINTRLRKELCVHRKKSVSYSSLSCCAVHHLNAATKLMNQM